MPRATMSDIAKRVGVSRATVSYILNGKEEARIPARTREKVLAAAAALDYRVNLVARSLKARQTQTIGVMVVNLLVRHHALPLRGIYEQASSHGYHLLLVDTRSSSQNEVEEITFLAQKNVDGLIIISASRYVDPRLPAVLQRLELPAVFVNQPMTRAGPLAVPVVMFDHAAGMYEAVRHLISLGHRRIGFIGAGMGTENPNFSATLRFSGYGRALAEAGIPVREGWVAAEAQERYTAEVGEAYAPQLIANGVQAIVAVNDEIAAGALQAAQGLGLVVPQDLSIIGCDDLETTKFVRPRLTTVWSPLQEAGKRAFAILLDLIRDPGGERPAEPPTTVLTPEMFVRESSGPAPDRGAQSP